jgi:hypothetical protein
MPLPPPPVEVSDPTAKMVAIVAEIVRELDPLRQPASVALDLARG